MPYDGCGDKELSRLDATCCVERVMAGEAAEGNGVDELGVETFACLSNTSAGQVAPVSSGKMTAE